MRLRRCRPLLLLVGLAGCGGSAPGAVAPGASPEPARATLDAEPIDSALAVLTFDSAWSRINTSYYDPDFRGLDWGAVRDDLRPAAARVSTRGELRAVLRDMLARLGESHFAILAEESVDGIEVDPGDEEEAGDGSGEVPLDLRWVEGELTVVEVFGDPEAVGPITAGWILDGVGDRDFAEWREVVASADSEAARKGLLTETVSTARALLAGSTGTEVSLALRDGTGTPRTVAARRVPIRGERVQFGALPAMVAHLEVERVERDGGCVGRIAFNVWMIPLVEDFNRAVDATADCTGMVIDLRGNPGGVGGMVMSTAGSFFGERADLGVLTSRTGQIRFVAMPRAVDTEGALRQPFEGRLAVLVDEMSMSTSEVFAAGLKSTGRARVFGRTTPGYALPAMTLRLPSGDVLYHVISNLTDPEGVRIEGRGVEPHEVIPLRRDDLLAGRDAALDAALDWAFGAN